MAQRGERVETLVTIEHVRRVRLRVDRLCVCVCQRGRQTQGMETTRTCMQWSSSRRLMLGTEHTVVHRVSLSLGNYNFDLLPTKNATAGQNSSLNFTKITSSHFERFIRLITD